MRQRTARSSKFRMAIGGLHRAGTSKHRRPGTLGRVRHSLRLPAAGGPRRIPTSLCRVREPGRQMSTDSDTGDSRRREPPAADLTGSCHCGAVRFEIETDFPELTMCDCSICRRKNALMVKVHESRFRLLAGEDALTEYRFHTQPRATTSAGSAVSIRSIASGSRPTISASTSIACTTSIRPAYRFGRPSARRCPEARSAITRTHPRRSATRPMTRPPAMKSEVKSATADAS